MANIIEREIAKRQDVIDSKVEKIARVDELKAEIDVLVAEIEMIDVDTLVAEIDELKTYLAEDVVDDSTDVEA